MMDQKIRRVQQKHDNGCFVACVAMLLNKSYDETFPLIFPNQDPNRNTPITGCIISYNPIRDCLDKMWALNLKAMVRIPSNIDELSNPAILFFRWKHNSMSMHAVVYDPYIKEILDPSFEDNLTIKNYSSRTILDSVIQIQ